MVSVLAVRNNSWTQRCGGTLVASKYVITSAYCLEFHDMSLTSTFVKLGEHNFTEDDGQEMTFDVSNTFIHPYYHPSTQTHDLAVLELAMHVDLALYTPACLAEAGDGDVGGLGQVLGFGIHDPHDPHEFAGGVLHEVDVPIVDNTRCSEVNGVFISGGKICVGATLGKAACDVSQVLRALLFVDIISNVFRSLMREVH